MGGNIILSWTLPSDTKFQGVHIRGDAAGPPRTSVEGTVHVTLTASWITYTTALPSDPYYFVVFPYDSQGRYGVGARLMVSGTQVIPASVDGAGQVVLLNGAEIAQAAEEADTLYLFVGTDQGLYRTNVGELTAIRKIFLPLIMRGYP